MQKKYKKIKDIIIGGIATNISQESVKIYNAFEVQKMKKFIN